MLGRAVSFETSPLPGAASGHGHATSIRWTHQPLRLLVALTLAAMTALWRAYVTPQVMMLGFMATGSTALALVLLERAVVEAVDEKREEVENGLAATDSQANASGSQRKLHYPEYFGVYKTASAFVSIACLVAAFAFEGSPSWMAYAIPGDPESAGLWTSLKYPRDGFLAVLLNIIMTVCFLRLVGHPLSLRLGRSDLNQADS